MQCSRVTHPRCRGAPDKSEAAGCDQHAPIQNTQAKCLFAFPGYWIILSVSYEAPMVRALAEITQVAHARSAQATASLLSHALVYGLGARRSHTKGRMPGLRRQRYPRRCTPSSCGTSRFEAFDTNASPRTPATANITPPSSE